MVADDGRREYIALFVARDQYAAGVFPTTFSKYELAQVAHQCLRLVDFTIQVEPAIVIFRVPLTDKWMGIAKVYGQVTPPGTVYAAIAVQVATRADIPPL